MARPGGKSLVTPSRSMLEPQRPERNAAMPNRAGPTHEQIAHRAYELFLLRGGTHGRHEEDWYQAERELRLGR